MYSPNIIAGSDNNANKVPFQISAVKQGSRAVIRIVGYIGWETTAEDFRAQVDTLIASGVKDAHVYMNTPGGSCFDANEIVNILSGFTGEITGEGGALVASAGTYIAMHCKKFSMPANGQFMIHKPSGIVSGTVTDLENYLKMMRDTEKDYHDTYAAMATDAEDFELKWLAGDNWMTAGEAKAAGFITEVREKVKIDRESAMMLAACGKGESNQHGNDPTKQINNNDMKMIALLLGLKEDATEAEILDKIREIQASAATAATLTSEINTIREGQITAMVDAALAQRKFTADKKEHFVSLGRTAGLEALRATLDCMQPELRPLDVLHQKTGGAAKKFSELTADERETLRAQNPDEYKKLYKEEYGIDCKL
jgi:ATP-dependent protease ClpP protease subunit